MPHTAALVAIVASAVASAAALSAPSSAPKAALFKAIDTFNAATAIDGTVPIDFGVKGGELDKKSRAPRNLFPDGFDAVSPAVGTAAKGVMAAVDAEELRRGGMGRRAVAGLVALAAGVTLALVLWDLMWPAVARDDTATLAPA